MGQFQSQVNIQPAPAVAGDFASANPRASVLAGPGALVAGNNGVTVGRFAWVDPVTGSLVNNTGVGVPSGFVHREQQALITQFLASNANLVPQGLPVTVHSAGDFWAKNDGSTYVTVGMKAFAEFDNGKVLFAPAGSAIAGASVTATVSANVIATASVVANSFATASISGTTLTVSSITSGLVYPNQTITGTGVAAGTIVITQLTGITGGVGTYQVNINQNVGPVAMTGGGGALVVTTMTSGKVVPGVGQTLTGGTVAAGTVILPGGSATGGAGTYAINTSTVSASGAYTLSGGYMNVTGVASGTLYPNDPISGGTIGAGSYIIGQLTGTPGGVGTYLTSDATASASATVTVAAAVETKWYAESAGAPGELIKISSWPLG